MLARKVRLGMCFWLNKLCDLCALCGDLLLLIILLILSILSRISFLACRLLDYRLKSEFQMLN